MKLKDGHLLGFISGRGINVTITANSADGFGPNGPANLKISEHDGQIDANGMWNGGPAHFTLGPASLRASVVVNPRAAGVTEISCGYTLDRLENNGALTGSVSCGGLPDETRIQMAPVIRQNLSPAELAVVLIATLAAPGV